jgi:hypothetical protein
MGLTPDKFTEIDVRHYDFDPNATTATETARVDMRDFRKFLVSFFRTVGTSDITLEIIAADAATGGNVATIATRTLTTTADAVGDYAFLQTDAERVRQKGETDGHEYRWVSARVTAATDTDEGVVTYIMGDLRERADGNPADHYST